MEKNDTKKTKIRIHFSLTTEEKNYYSKIFDLLDYEKNGKLSSDFVAHFMRDSGLNNKILKEIFLLTPHNDIHYNEKKEFFIMLRLIGLAQNKVPFTEDSLEKNTPIPPLPVFINFKEGNIINKQNIFEITEENKTVYTSIFYEKKDTGKDYISKLRTNILWDQKNQKQAYINEKIFQILEPLEQPNYLNLKEFIVGTHLLFLSKIIKVPKYLPQYLSDYLGRNIVVKESYTNNNTQFKNIDENNNVTFGKTENNRTKDINNQICGRETVIEKWGPFNQQNPPIMNIPLQHSNSKNMTSNSPNKYINTFGVNDKNSNNMRNSNNNSSKMQELDKNIIKKTNNIDNNYNQISNNNNRIDNQNIKFHDSSLDIDNTYNLLKKIFKKDNNNQKETALQDSYSLKLSNYPTHSENLQQINENRIHNQFYKNNYNNNITEKNKNYNNSFIRGNNNHK